MSLASRPIARRGVHATLARWLPPVGVGLVLGIVAVVLVARVYYPRLLYPAPRGDRNAPAEGRLLKLTSRDGVPVHAIDLSGPKDATVIVYFHGNGEAMGDVLWMAREFRQRGLRVVLVEYRGYGLSAGSASPSEAGLYEDAATVLAALAREGIPSERIALFGVSLGTGVAVEMAARGHGASLVLVTPYTSIPDVASRFAFGLPVEVVMSERFDSLAKAPRVAVPTLLLHGTDDEIVPYAMGLKLATAFSNARLLSVQGGRHNDLFLGDGSRLFDEVASFVRDPH